MQRIDAYDGPPKGRSGFAEAGEGFEVADTPVTTMAYGVEVRRQPELARAVCDNVVKETGLRGDDQAADFVWRVREHGVVTTGRKGRKWNLNMTQSPTVDRQSVHLS
jgi:hypothetical protein